MASLTKTRIESLDLLKGLVMLIMALDHTRDYFHYSVHFFDPSDPTQSTLPIFFTRWITNFCAPAFSFLAGLSAFLVGRRKTKNQLSGFLLKRGLWLVCIEFTFVTFAWRFDIYFREIGLQVIWVLGISMILLAGLIHLPKRFLFVLSCAVIFGHNLLDNIHFEGNFLWSLLHERNRFHWAGGRTIILAYPLLPWFAVMSLGYCFGGIYSSDFDASQRRKILNAAGIGSLILLAILIAWNTYGDPVRWTNYGNTAQTLMSILNATKYPPSLMFLLMTLGGTFLFLANSEHLKGKAVNFLSVYGRVPFLYYILHIYLIHFIALFVAEFTGYGWQSMILPTFVTRYEILTGYGVSLPVVYLIWIFVIVALYPVCKKFDSYKQSHKEKWWLSYL